MKSEIIEKNGKFHLNVEYINNKKTEKYSTPFDTLTAAETRQKKDQLWFMTLYTDSLVRRINYQQPNLIDAAKTSLFFKYTDLKTIQKNLPKIKARLTSKIQANKPDTEALHEEAIKAFTYIKNL